MTDNNNNKKSIIDIDDQYQKDISDFSDNLIKLGFGNYTNQYFDFYDSSVLFLEVKVGEKLTLSQMKYLKSRGLSIAFLEYVDGSKKVYDIHKALEYGCSW